MDIKTIIEDAIIDTEYIGWEDIQLTNLMVLKETMYKVLKDTKYVNNKNELYALCRYIITEIYIGVDTKSHITEKFIIKNARKILKTDDDILKSEIKEFMYVPEELNKISRLRREIFKLAVTASNNEKYNEDIYIEANTKVKEINELKEELFKRNYEYIDKEEIQSKLIEYEIDYTKDIYFIAKKSNEQSDQMIKYTKFLKSDDLRKQQLIEIWSSIFPNCSKDQIRDEVFFMINRY